MDFLGPAFCRKSLWDRRKDQGSISLLKKKKALCERGNDWKEAQGDFLGAENALDLELGGAYTSVNIYKSLSS